MDLRERDQMWISQIDTIFKCTAQGDEKEGGQSGDLKNTLKGLLRKRMRIWWNKASLESYLAKGLIPRGLRVQVFPSFPIEDQLFRTRWEEACGGCSKVFMELLIGMNKKTLETLEAEIESTKTKLATECTPSSLENLRSELDALHLVWEKEIQEIKSKKFLRDSTDFQTNRVYR